MTRNVYAMVGLLFVVVFAIVGILFGTPHPTSEGKTFGDILRAFANDTKTRSILAFILVDVVTGVMTAIRLKTFDIQRIAAFHASNVVPYILGYLLVWCLTLLGLDGVLPQAINEMLTSISYGAIMAALTGSIMDNVLRMNAAQGVTIPNDPGIGPGNA